MRSSRRVRGLQARARRPEPRRQYWAGRWQPCWYWMPSCAGRRQESHLLGDGIAPIAALGHIFLVLPGASSARSRRARYAPATQPGQIACPENPWLGSDGITTSKASEALPPCATGLVSGSMIFICSITELWPPMRHDQRKRIRILRPHMNEVNVEAIDLGLEIRESVQSGFRLFASRILFPNNARA